MRQPFEIAIYGVLAAVVISAFIYEDEVKQQIDTQLRPFTAATTEVHVGAAEQGAANSIYLIDYMVPCEEYRDFAGAVLGVTTKTEMEAYIDRDPTFRKLDSNEYMVAYQRGGWGAFADQRISLMFDHNFIFSGAIVSTFNVHLSLVTSFLNDQMRGHGCLGMPWNSMRICPRVANCSTCDSCTQREYQSTFSWSQAQPQSLIA